jgi:hypothetical protein
MYLWITSLKGTITLSVIALLAFVGYTFLESRYFLEQWIPGVTAAAVETVIVIAITGGWLWALFAAADGSRGALIAVLIFGALPGLMTLYDLIFYSPIPYGWPLMQIMVWTTFVTSVLGTVVVALQLRP